jgi:hypothetical protein
MQYSEFTIGITFWCYGSLWRCTDIGTRIIIAIQIDRVAVGSTSPEWCRALLGGTIANAKSGSGPSEVIPDMD